MRTVRPWDRVNVPARERAGVGGANGRVPVVHVAVQVASFGAEIAVVAAEAGARIARLAAPRVPKGNAHTPAAAERLSGADIAGRITGFVA